MFNFNAKKMLSKDMAIDLGTASVIVYVDGKGIVLREPSVVAVDTDADCIVQIGKEAQAMLGRNPDHINVIRPLKEGVIPESQGGLKRVKVKIQSLLQVQWTFWTPLSPDSPLPLSPLTSA